MQKKLFIPLLLGSGRDGRVSEKLARFVFGEFKKIDLIETEFIDVRDFNFRFTDDTDGHPEVERWRALVTRADGLLIVSPEYNHGYPGELKMLLDAAFEEYFKKPVGLCTVSNGGFGGVRMAANLKPVLVQLGLVVCKNVISFPKAQELFDETGAMKDLSYIEKLKPMFEELLWFGKALKIGREGNV